MAHHGGTVDSGGEGGIANVPALGGYLWRNVFSDLEIAGVQCDRAATVCSRLYPVKKNELKPFAVVLYPRSD